MDLLRKEQWRTPVALVIAMDRSGSMSMATPDGREKVAVAPEGAVGALALLSPGDETAVRVVDSRAHEIVRLTPIEKGYRGFGSHGRAGSLPRPAQPLFSHLDREVRGRVAWGILGVVALVLAVRWS